MVLILIILLGLLQLRLFDSAAPFEVPRMLYEHTYHHITRHVTSDRASERSSSQAGEFLFLSEIIRIEISPKLLNMGLLHSPATNTRFIFFTTPSLSIPSSSAPPSPPRSSQSLVNNSSGPSCATRRSTMLPLRSTPSAVPLWHVVYL